MGVEQPVERFRAAGQFQKIALQCLGECIEQRPGVPRCEGIVARHSPLGKHTRHEFVRADAHVHRADDEVVRGAVFNPGEFVRREAGVLVMPPVHQFADRALHEARQIPGDMCGVLTGEFDLSRKCQIIANEDRGAGDNSGREGLVVAVPQAEDPAIVFIGFRAHHLHEPEIARAVVAEAVGLGADDEAVGLQGALDVGDQVEVRDGRPRRRAARRGDELNFLAFDFLRAAVEAQIWVGAFGGRRLIENSDHGIFLSINCAAGDGRGLVGVSEPQCVIAHWLRSKGRVSPRDH